MGPRANGGHGSNEGEGQRNILWLNLIETTGPSSWKSKLVI